MVCKVLQFEAQYALRLSSPITLSYNSKHFHFRNSMFNGNSTVTDVLV